jgi:hypothetical protein
MEPILTTTKECSFPFSSVIHGMQGFARLRFTQPELAHFPSLTRGLSLYSSFASSLSVSQYSTDSTVRQPYFTYRPARLHKLANRFLGSLNVYKFGL